jgi:hypothetical protein
MPEISVFQYETMLMGGDMYKMSATRREGTLSFQKDAVVRIRTDMHGEAFDREASAYRTGMLRGWPIPSLLSESGPDRLVIEWLPHDARTVPSGYDKEDWVWHVSQFWRSLPFCHNDPTPEHIVYENPEDLRAIDLEDIRFIEDGETGANDYWAGLLMIEMCITHLKAPGILIDYYTLRESVDEARNEWDHPLLEAAWEMNDRPSTRIRWPDQRSRSQ